MARTSKMGLLPLAASIFFVVSGGPFGIEETVQKAGISTALLMIAIVPFVWAIPAALMSAELGSAIPREGGYYWWVHRAFGPFAGFLCAAWSWMYSWVDVAIYPVLFATYVGKFAHIGHMTPLMNWLLGLGILVPMTLLNLRGALQVGLSSLLFLAVLLVPFIALIFRGFGQGGPVAMSDVSHAAIAPALYAVMWNYLGWDSLSTVLGEVEGPKRTFPKALLLTIPIVILLYLLPVWAGWQVMPDAAKWEDGAWLAILEKAGGPTLYALGGAAAVVYCAGLTMSTMLGASRLPMVLAEDGIFPKWLGAKHPRFGTPWAAIVVSAVFYFVLSFQSFQSLAELDVIIYSAALLLEFGALVALRRDAELERPFRIPGGLFTVLLTALAPVVLVGFALYQTWNEQGRETMIWIGLILLIAPAFWFGRKLFGNLNPA
ncbi:MAG: APC family permease [Armatimonadetes bacterium]|nr:APC family permease [Armatimonadota bacterium]